MYLKVLTVVRGLIHIPTATTFNKSNRLSMQLDGCGGVLPDYVLSYKIKGLGLFSCNANNDMK